MNVSPGHAWSSSSSDGTPTPKKKFMVKIKPHPLAASQQAHVIMQPAVTPPAQASPKGKVAVVVSSSPKGWDAPLPAWLSPDMINAAAIKSRKSSSSDSGSSKKPRKFAKAVMSKVPGSKSSLFVPRIAPPPKFVAQASMLGAPLKKSSRSSSGPIITDGWGIPPNINTEVGSAVTPHINWGTPRGSPVKKSGSSSPKLSKAVPVIVQPVVKLPAKASPKVKGAVVEMGSSASESQVDASGEKFLTDLLKQVKTEDKVRKRLARYYRLLREQRIPEAKQYFRKHKLLKHMADGMIGDMVEVGNSPSGVIDITPPGFSPSDIVQISSSDESPSGKKIQPLSFGQAFEKLGVPVNPKGHKGVEVVSKASKSSASSSSKKKDAAILDQLHKKVMNIAVSPTFKKHNLDHGGWAG